MEIVTPVITNWTSEMQACIEAVDIGTGAAETLLKTNLPIQAPSWSPCGSYLIANAAGRLYRIALDRDRRVLEQILVDRLHSTNSDHAISPDGKLLALTDKTEFGKSAVYVMRLNARFPDLVVAAVPAWFHGWAPDSRTIAYSCVRNGLWSIGICDIEGGRERLILQAEPGSGHHLDAPEFSADGEWIWFNSNRGGAMALWRIRPDGSNAQQMTDGSGEDWFPHPSPDGRHICYLSYDCGTRGHPFGRDVELRLMPAGGGPPRTIRRSFGGQGTLNAPCWAPDSRRFVHARYTGADAEPDAPGLGNVTRTLADPPEGAEV